MKKQIAIAVLCALALTALVACGENPAPATTDPTTTEAPTTEAPTTTAPVTTAPITTAPVTTAAPTTTKPAETSVKPEATVGVETLYGTWTVVGGTATTTIGEKEITEKDGIPATFGYTVKNKTVDGDGNFSCVVVANNSEFTYIVYKNKTGYAAYSYMEIITNKATLKYAK